ncbi:MAG: ABC transporter substrate-binding protein [Balneolales bacterium]
MALFLSKTTSSGPSGLQPFSRVHGLPDNFPVFLFLIIPMIFLMSCGSTPEITVVDRTAQTVEDDDNDGQEIDDEELRILKMGEVNQIRSFDPLFASNTTTKRIIQLAYEGLVRFDEHDNITAAAAKQWDVSSDSLTWTFYLRNDLFFHDDQSFTQGIGRRVNSRDVIRVFERMASRDVPPNAAELFMNTIQGFESYYLERRNIYMDVDRSVTSIRGIEARNDTTIVFHLENNGDFLQKLASPYAVIYPREPFLFHRDGLHTHAVGTGPFQFETSIGDSIHIFLRNKYYYRKNEQGQQLPRVHRLEVLNTSDETSLYSQFTRGLLNMIVDLGPNGVSAMVDENNELNEDLRNHYRMESRSDPNPVILRYHPRNLLGLERGDAASLIRNIRVETIRDDMNNPLLEITYKDEEYTQANVGRIFQRYGDGQENQLLFAYKQDLLPRKLSEIIFETLDNNLQVDLIQRRVFSRDIFLYLDYLHTYVPGYQHARQPQEILRIETNRYTIFDQHTRGVRTNNLSWWLDLNHVRMEESSQQNPEAVYR